MSLDRPTPHFVGFTKPLMSETWEFATEINLHRLRVLTDIVTEINTNSPLSVLIVDSLAYGLTLRTSDINFHTFIPGDEEEMASYEFRMKIAQRLQGIQHHHFSTSNTQQIQDDLAFIQVAPESLTAKDFQMQRRHTLLELSDFYHELFVGGILLGTDYSFLIDTIREIAKTSKLLHSATVAREQEYRARSTTYFHTRRKRAYMTRLQKSDPTYLSLSGEKKREKVARVEAAIATVFPIEK
jgi:hypothetical protein